MCETSSHLVDVEHVQINAAQLYNIGMAQSFASSDICLEDVCQLLDSFRVFQHLDIVCGLVDDSVPYLNTDSRVTTYTQQHGSSKYI